MRSGQPADRHWRGHARDPGMSHTSLCAHPHACLPIMTKVPGDRRDQPALPPQRVRFHIVSPVEYPTPLRRDHR